MILQVVFIFGCSKHHPVIYMDMINDNYDIRYSQTISWNFKCPVMLSAFIGVLKFCEKGFKKTNLGHLIFWFNFSWKASALPKQCLKVPESRKQFKCGSEIKPTGPYEGTGFGHFLVDPKLKLKDNINICQHGSEIKSTCPYMRALG